MMMATGINAALQADVETISNINVVNSILEVVCKTTGMGFAAIARVTEEKWVACAVRDEINFGLLPGGELVLESTICHEIRQNHTLVAIDHVAQDKNYASHHTPLMYGFQSYISVPITLKNGNFFGTLCAIDPNPNQVNNSKIIGMFTLFADLIAFHLNAVEQLAFSELNLLEERKTAELREQFIAILGHDLRNPVGAVLNVAQLLLAMPLDEKIKRLALIVQNSSYRMRGLINNIMDFASGRLGGGITLEIKANEPLEHILGQVIAELKLIWPNRIIDTTFNLTEPVDADGKRIAQLFSNLLSNALTHGNKEAPVMVEINSADGRFVLSVSNAGEKIPAPVMNRIFEPFSRGGTESRQEGLGLGLYIASQIAIAHQGELLAVSTDEETRFTLMMPVSFGKFPVKKL